MGDWPVWNRSWQLMPLLWLAAVDGGNSGLITPVSTNHCSRVCDSSAFGSCAPRWAAAQPNLSACILVKWIVAINGQWGRCGGFCSGWWVIGRRGRRHQDFFDVSVICLFGRSHAPNRCAGGQLIFHWRCSWDRGWGGVEGSRGWCHGRGRLWGLGVGRVGNSQRWEEGVKFLVWCRSQWRGSGCFARRSPTACRFSEFIMNVLLFFPFSLTFLFSFALCHFPPSLHLERHFHKRPPPCHRTVSPSVLRAKNKELCEGPLVASPPGPAVAVS